jgi:excisionase family DNA binding protein
VTRHLTHDDDAAQAYSIEETANRLGVHRTTVYDLINTGRLGSIKVGGRRLIPRAALLALLEPVPEEAAHPDSPVTPNGGQTDRHQRARNRAAGAWS